MVYMKGKKKQNKNSEKLFAFVLFTIACVLGLIYAMNPNVFSSLVINRGYIAAGDEPYRKKDIVDNHDGTYQLYLEVKGEAEKKPQKANVIVVFDTSSSMNDSSGTSETTYIETSDNIDDLYGKVDGEYVPLTRVREYNPYSGTYNRNTTYYGYYNNEYHELYLNNGVLYRNRSWSFFGGYSYSNPYSGTVYTYDYNYYLEDGTKYTGQRYYKDEAGQSRLQAAKKATNSLAKSLLSNNGGDNDDDTIEIALVDFANSAEIAQNPTTSYSDFEAAVNARNAGTNNRGTNWEAGFTTAASVDFDDDDPTYVIFVSDGNPTFRNTQNGTVTADTGNTPWRDYNNTYGAYGTGGESKENISNSYSKS